jgi:hypothetical protein
VKRLITATKTNLLCLDERKEKSIKKEKKIFNFVNLGLLPKLPGNVRLRELVQLATPVIVLILLTEILTF